MAILAAGVALIYQRILHGPFVYDDFASIVDNPTIRSLHDLGKIFSPPAASGVGGRPLLNLSFALNFACGGSSVVGYHLTNLSIHLLASCVLFGLIRCTLLLPRLAPRFGSDASLLALAATALWAWHPLQTQSVTYLSQRAESLMGLWYLLCLYCFVRASVAGERRMGWWISCVVFCAFGMATKETMVTAPVIVLLYDRTFLAESWAEAWSRRRGGYLALVSTWLIVGFLAAGLTARGVGIDHGVGFAVCVLTQAKAVATYLELVVWPHPLIFDRGEPWVSSLTAVWSQVLVVAGLLTLTVWALRRKPELGFLLACFFIMLAPTSSIIPIAGQPIAENRLYLPLAAPICLITFSSYAWRGRRAVGLIGVVAVGMAAMAARRNEVYRSPQALWRDTILKCPENARAHNNLGQILLQGGSQANLSEAAAEMQEALRLAPAIPTASEIQNNLGDALSRMGRNAEATEHFEEAIRLRPEFGVAHYNLGNAWTAQQQLTKAETEYRAAIRSAPGFAPAHNNLGKILHALGQESDAMREVATAVRLDPDLADAHFNLGCALMGAGRSREAASEFEEVLRLQPDANTAKVLLARLVAGHP